MLLLIDLKGGENTKSKRLFIISIILVFLYRFTPNSYLKVQIWLEK